MKNQKLHSNWQDQLTDKVISPYSEPDNYFTEFTEQLLLQIKMDALPKTNAYAEPVNYLATVDSNSFLPKPVKKRWIFPKIAIACCFIMVIGISVYKMQQPATGNNIAVVVDTNQIQEADAEAYLLENAEEDIVKTLPENSITNLENISPEEIDIYLQQEEI